MNDAHFHLLINHIPILGLVFGFIILLAGILLKSVVTRRVSYFILLIAGIFALPSFSSGEGAEEVIEHMDGMSKETHHLIHEHEEKAEFFMPFAWGVIFFSLLCFFVEWKKKNLAMYSAIILLIVSGVSLKFAQEVGNSGGEIAHPEIRKDFKSEHHDDHEEHEERDDD